MPAAIASYVVLGPMVFLGPLLPFRNKMLKVKEDEKRRASLRFKTACDRYIGNSCSIADAANELECAQKMARS